MPAPTFEDAIEALRSLPPERQQELAAYICHLATDEPEDIDPADLPSVIKGIAQAERIEFETDEQVAAVFARFGK